MASFPELLRIIIDRNASDLHITAGSPRQIRIDGALNRLPFDAMSRLETKVLCYSIMTDAQKKQFEQNNELDIAFGINKLSLFRANFFLQRGCVAGAFRAIPHFIPSFNELGLHPVIKELNRVAIDTNHDLPVICSVPA